MHTKFSYPKLTPAFLLSQFEHMVEACNAIAPMNAKHPLNWLALDDLHLLELNVTAVVHLLTQKVHSGLECKQWLPFDFNYRVFDLNTSYTEKSIQKKLLWFPLLH